MGRIVINAKFYIKLLAAEKDLATLLASKRLS